MRLILTIGSDKPKWVPRLCTSPSRERYAILSHRWHEDPTNEILFADIEIIDDSATGSVKNSQYADSNPRVKAAFPKLQGAARRALADSYLYLWVDTCCIDKNSSAELAAAINSMFKWYSTAAVCYVYLADCATPDYTSQHGREQFVGSQWWTRGWTLQELLAPHHLIFFTSTWEEIGRKDEKRLTSIISEASRINVNVVNGTIPLSPLSVAQRMSFASRRVTSRPEDIAYSLMGIFSVNMPLLYGEGDKAFLRLQLEIIKESDDETIFAWTEEQAGLNLGQNPDTSSPLKGLLATQPSAFSYSGSILPQHSVETGVPFAMTNTGLSISLPLQSVDQDLYIAWLRCSRSEDSGRAAIYLKRLPQTAAVYARVRRHELVSDDPEGHIPQASIYVRQYFKRTPAYEELNHGNGTIRLT